MMNMLKKAQKKLENYLVDKEFIPTIVQYKPEDDLLFINSRIAIWRKRCLNKLELENINNNNNYMYSVENIVDLFKKNFKDNYLVINFTNSEIENFKEIEKVVNIKIPNYPIFTLQFILDLSVQIKGYQEPKNLISDIMDESDISTKKEPINLIFYDNATSVRI